MREFSSGKPRSVGCPRGRAAGTCSVARFTHSKADIQEDVSDELLWDLTALVAAD